MNVGATEQASRAVSGLWRPSDEAGAFEIVHAAIKRAHGLLSTSREQFAPGENGGVGAGRIDCAGQRRE
jgi:hypothetical protein